MRLLNNSISMLMDRYLLLILSFLFISSATLAQSPCGYDFFLQNVLKDTIFADKQDTLEQDILHFFRKHTHNSSTAAKGNLVLTIPVVIHILHHGGPENITDAQAQAAVQYLNAAFANTGYFFQGSGAVSNIRFCLATRDPQGNATNGILRVQTPLTNVDLAQDGLAKSPSRWPTQEYLNIWVVREICWESLGCGVGAYASPPAFHGRQSDGIVIKSRYFGATPGFTSPLAHETGHYLGLYHTFEGGCENNDCLIDGDRICDTPPDQRTAAIPCDQSVNTCNTDVQSGLTSDLPDATDNFLDYGDITCQHNFTACQAARMEFVLENTRKSLLVSKGCLPPCPAPVTADFIPGDTIISIGTALSFSSQTANAGNVSWLLNGQSVAATANWSNTFTQQGVFTVTLNAQAANAALCPARQVEHTLQVVCPVQANFLLNPSTPVLGEPVVVTNLSKNFTTVEWFINGVSQDSTLNTYTFTKKGAYTIRLVADNGLCQREKILIFTLSEECSGSLFQKIIDTPAEIERAKASVALSDGNLLLGGEGVVVASGWDMIFIKTNQEGTPLWTKRFGDGRNQFLEDLLPAEDGGFVIIGTQMTADSVKNALVARFSASGEVIWQKQLLSEKGSYLRRLIRSGNDFIAAGWFIPEGSARKSGFIIKFDPDGTRLWSRVYEADQEMEFTDVDQISSSQSIYLSGIIGELDGNGTDGLITSLNLLGGLPVAKRVQSIPLVFPFPPVDEILYGINAHHGTYSSFVGYVTNLSSSPPLEQGWIIETNFTDGISGTGTIGSTVSGFNLQFDRILKTPDPANKWLFNFKNQKIGSFFNGGIAAQTSIGNQSILNGFAEIPGKQFLLSGETYVDGKTKMLWAKVDQRGNSGICSGSPVASILNNVPISRVDTV